MRTTVVAHCPLSHAHAAIGRVGMPASKDATPTITLDLRDAEALFAWRKAILTRWTRTTGTPNATRSNWPVIPRWPALFLKFARKKEPRRAGALADSDIQRLAHLFIQLDGERAIAKAREMVEQMRRKGDNDGAASGTMCANFTKSPALARP